MLIVYGARSTTPGSAPTRASLAQSSATSVRSSASAGRSRTRPRSASSRNRYSAGSGAGPPRNMTTSLPSCSSASPAARSEPTASPSGASWEVTRKRSRLESTSTTAAMSLVWVFACAIGALGGELVDHLRQPDAPLDRGIVFEPQHRGATQPQGARDRGLQDAVRSGETLERPLALGLGPEHADVHGRVRVVARGVDARHGHEPDPRVLEGRKGVREHLPDRLVHASAT